MCQPARHNSFDIPGKTFILSISVFEGCEVKRYEKLSNIQRKKLKRGERKKWGKPKRLPKEKKAKIETRRSFGFYLPIKITKKFDFKVMFYISFFSNEIEVATEVTKKVFFWYFLQKALCVSMSRAWILHKNINYGCVLEGKQFIFHDFRNILSKFRVKNNERNKTETFLIDVVTQFSLQMMLINLI